jgi:hypothetical protein
MIMQGLPEHEADFGTEPKLFRPKSGHRYTSRLAI